MRTPSFRQFVATLIVFAVSTALHAAGPVPKESGPVGPVIILPEANVAATDDTVYYSGDTSAVFTITLSAAPASKITVDYKLKGSAANGIDYVLLSGKAKFKAGKTSKSVLIVPKGDLRGASSRTVKLVLEATDDYTLGTSPQAKVKIIHSTLIVLP